MKIGVDIRPLMEKKRAGIGEFTFEFLDALFQIDTENEYYLFYNSSKNLKHNIEKHKKSNIFYVRSKWPNKIFNFSQVFLGGPKIDKIIEKRIGKKLDIFYSPNIGFTNISKRTKFVLTIHDLSYKIFSDCYSVKRRLWHTILNPKRMTKKADVIIVPSESTKRDLIKFYNTKKSKIKVLYPGICNHFFHTNEEGMNNVRLKYNLSKIYILFLGTIEPRKNLEAIISAFSDMNTDEYELVIAGGRGWKCAGTMNMIKKTKGVRYLGYIDSDDRVGLCSGAGLFVFPSLYEGFGFPILEALASGTPVITSNRSSLPELISEGVYLVNPLNIGELCVIMQNILNKKVVISDKTKEDLSLKFDWKRFGEGFLSICRDFSKNTDNQNL